MSEYISYFPGNYNILVAAPHGGSLKPSNIPDRKTGTKVRDTYSKTLAEEIYRLGKQDKTPHTILSNIHRCKVDLNREIKEGAQESKRAQAIWNEWNDVIKTAIKNIGGKMLYVDIHSHNDNDTFQLGYNLNIQQYLELMKAKKTSAKSTLDSLSPNKYDMIFGRFSLKKSLEKDGYKVYTPTPGEVYFNGGKNIETYNGKGIGAIQIECPVSILKTDLDNVAKSLYSGILKFVEKFVNVK